MIISLIVPHIHLQYSEAIENFHVCCNTDACLNYLKRYENYDMAIGGTRLHILASSHYSPDDIFCFDESESLLTYQVALLLKNGSNFEIDINRIIRNSFEAGLFSKWESANLKVKHRTGDDQPLQMTMENLLMPLIFVLGIGLPAACLVFLSELVIFRKVKQRNSSQIWHLLHQMCDAERKFFYIQPLPAARKLPESIPRR